jgi:hypothetical protein
MTQEPERAAAVGGEKGGAAGDTRRPWWQWVMLHPQVPVAMISLLAAAIGYLAANVPNFLQWKAARDLNVPTSELARVQEQLKAWADNSECLKAEIQQVNLRSPSTYTIAVQSCPSGDILLALTPLHAPTNTEYRWIVTRSMFKPQAGLSFTTMALAEVAQPRPPGPSPTLVIDSRPEGRTVVRRLQLSDRTCIDEVVDTVTGRRPPPEFAECSLHAVLKPEVRAARKSALS